MVAAFLSLAIAARFLRDIGLKKTRRRRTRDLRL